MKNITHLMFSGGGFCGLCLLGIIRYLYFYKYDKKIFNIAGTSMGSYMALFFALKVPYEEIERILKAICFDDKALLISKNNITDLFINNGLDDTKNYLRFLKEYIKKHYDLEDISFLELSKKFGVNFYVSSTNVNLSTNTIFSITSTPNVSIFDAVASSMSLPLISKPVYIDGYYYVDGGLTNNFPLYIFDNIPKEYILGVAINYTCCNNYTDDIPKDTKDISFIDYMSRIFKILIYNSLKETYYNYINDNNDILIIDNINLDFFKIHCKDNNNLSKVMTPDEIDYLTILGYTKIYEFMKKNKDNKDI